MPSQLLAKRRVFLSESTFVEFVVWQVPVAVPESSHRFKYRLALVDEGRCVLRYDNEAGKGDHKHVDEAEVPYRFVDLPTLERDFWNDVRMWMSRWRPSR